MWLLRVLVRINKDYRETRQVSSFTSLGSRRIRDRRVGDAVERGIAAAFFAEVVGAIKG